MCVTVFRTREWVFLRKGQASGGGWLGLRGRSSTVGGGLYLLLMYLLSTTTPLRTRSVRRTRGLVSRTRGCLCGGPGRTSCCTTRTSTLFPRSRPDRIHTRTVVLCYRTRRLLKGFSLDVGGLCSARGCVRPAGGGRVTRLYSLVKHMCDGLNSCGGTVRLGSGTASVFGSVNSSASITKYCGRHKMVRRFVDRFAITRHFFRHTLTVGHTRQGLGRVTAGLGGLYLCQKGARRGLSFVRRTVAVGGGLSTR